MSRTHFSNKHRLAMAGAAVAVVLLLLCLLNSNVFSFVSIDKADADTLELLHVVFRHGPRTPADTYPNDPHINQTFSPFGWGHITNNGKRELFGIGTWLRKRYADFLSPYYTPDAVHAQATGVARTHMTLQTVLASFFPPKDTPMEWHPKYNWQPVPVFSQPLNEDSLLLVRTPCPRYFEALSEVLELPNVKAEIEPYLDMLSELSLLTGMNLTQPEDVQSLYLTLLAEQEFGLKLPDWTKSYFPQQMQFLTDQSYIYNVYTSEMQKIKAGPFLQKMFTEMLEKRNDKLKPQERKMFIYTGHDTTVVNILSSLKIWKRQLPRYSVMTIFELHKNKDNGEYYVEVYFRSHAKAPIEKLTVPGCNFQCPLDKLIELSGDVLPNEPYDVRCASKNEGFTEPPLKGP
ncbi:venom acid phosphatase Acph-1 isoform X1 [Bactrocera oleae]|uniref:venom acid phosphatase Acph-1 isoform X1 n=1 Tax=Bactrocera oleae TaxID=104688 RepID=UPI0006B7616E|nr:venom acid phosphatase Acph-1 isoform X1 [Bactrocera oleae]XP_014094604.1 venom acid phosphatase Acph-1 isoform X1 [Bactrocera oleae]XP_014094609.1 venom acid phosphatase Acph-1 isoform X1 [Bactrocera oleae]XP_014094616.1 venom acid phosphatase Acph-1 isoform X1 [Bactrocera oleae]XP_014094624.1 venom acid phosphatase Acph-1 isoform X1 [Bactrocera oleae]XP_036228208.1 venom acid phosphatase Acph-1 isoform X1 [Bactrocera oleae]XP_036228209.1 venom acid phosphatase Acph-1 isoform X1 [Bactroce